MSTSDVELTAMTSVWDALQSLPDKEAQLRCITWALSRLGLTLPTGPGVRAGSPVAPSASPLTSPTPSAAGGDSLEDIVEQTEDGRFRVIARDLKARSRNDAALRLVHLVLYANEIIGGQQKTSSRKFVIPVLKDWRAYDGNTRVAIANSRGIKREGDLLSLDIHSRRDAQNYVTQIRDESTKGSWSPSGARIRKAGMKAAGKAAK